LRQDPVRLAISQAQAKLFGHSVGGQQQASKTQMGVGFSGVLNLFLAQKKVL